MKGEADLVAVPHRENFRQVAGFADERIVRGHGPVRIQADQLADVVRRILRVPAVLRELERPADGHVQLAVRPEQRP